ncbi:MAG: putative Ig domain-containing protein [Bryobacteraceae bacterium]
MVSLGQAAPANGTTVALQANTSRIQVPAQVLVPAGAQSVQFVASVISSDQDAQAQITASVQGALTTANLSITGIRPTSVSCTPQTVQAGGFFTCTIGMNNPNILQVARLAVTSDNPKLELPSPFTTRPAQAQLSFEVFTTPLAEQQPSVISVQFDQTTVTSSVVVMPATAPVLSLPGTELAAFGKPLAFTFSATDPGGLPLNLSAANLPPGATFNPATGGFLWTPQAPTGLIYQVGKLYPLERREVTFTATDSAQMSANGSVVIEADPGNPVITDLRNAGSQAPQAVPPKVTIPTQPTTMSCAPGSVASLVGRWLASGTQPASDPTGSSTQLAGAEVMVNGNLAPVVYASATRLDFLCPDSVSGGELEISAQIDGTVSNAIHADQQATLGLYSADGSGQGQGMATLSGTSLLATPRSYLNNGQPAEPGDTISILATGAGLETSPSLVRLSIGGASTTATQIQAVPGMAGVYQINVIVPASVSPGDAVPVVLKATDSNGNAISSNTVTIAVEAAR